MLDSLLGLLRVLEVRVKIERRSVRRSLMKKERRSVRRSLMEKRAALNSRSRFQKMAARTPAQFFENLYYTKKNSRGGGG